MRLHEGALHIWHANLDAAHGQVDGLLNAQEHRRAAQIIREPAKQRWMTARGILRVLLGLYLEECPRALRFAYGPYGKPMLDRQGGKTLHFNLSHTSDLGAFALSETSAVGIDVELVNRRLRSRPLSHDFLRAWVRREARAKRTGMGLGTATELPPAHIPEVWIADLDVGPQAVGAVAMAAQPVDFRVYAFDFRACRSILPASTNHDPP